MPNAGNEEMVLFVLPDGSGSPFSEAQTRYDGDFLDAHIELRVLDAYGTPVPNYPMEDMWLESTGGGMVSCSGGTCADVNTDQNGLTLWETPLHAGGFSDSSLQVVVNGFPLNMGPFPMAIVSADMNGDGAVNLSDIGYFSSLFFNEYAFEADLFADGVLNLADVGRLALGKGATCP